MFHMGLQFNNYWGFYNPFMCFQNRLMNFMMQYSIMESFVDSLFTRPQRQYMPQPQVQPLSVFQYQIPQQPQIPQPVVQPFDNSMFENYMANRQQNFNSNLTNIFLNSYESQFSGKRLNTTGLLNEAAPCDAVTKIVEEAKKNVEAASQSPVASVKSDNITDAAKTNNSAKKIVISRSQITDIVHRKAAQYGVDERLILAMIGQESSFVNGQTSHKGAKGLMQLMPATAKEYGVTDVNDPEQNIDGGVRFMKKLLDTYNGDVKKALAAYNSGMGNVNDILNGTNKCQNNPQLIKDPSGIPRIKETQDYVKKIYNSYKNYTVA